MNEQTQDRLPKTFWWHNVTVFGGAMNDNLFKLLMVYALIAWHGQAASANILASVGLVFALPYLLIVPIAGNFADKFSKQKMIVYLKALEFTIMAVGVSALHLQSTAMLYATMFLMSSQSAFFGPCKYGIIPEQVGSERLSRANGMLQLSTFLAIISGTVLAPELSLFLGGRYSYAASACLIIAALGFMASLNIQATPAHPQRKLSLNGVGNLKVAIQFIVKDGFLTLSILALSVFALSAAFIQLNILNYGYEHLGLMHEQATRLFLLTAIGIGIGSAFAGYISGRSIEFGIVPIGAGLMSLCLYLLGTLAANNIVLASVCMLALGFAAGLFIVPLESFIQYRSPADRVGSIQAAHAFINWAGILLASGLLFLNSSVLGWSAQQGFLLLSFALLGLAIFSLWVLPDFLLKFVLMLFTRFCYRLRVHGIHNIPSDKPALLVCNHVSLLDAVLLVSTQQRRIRMLMSREYYDNSSWLTRKVVDLAQVILIHSSDNPKKLLQSLKTARGALDEGYLVCIFAEGALSRTGMMRPFKPGFERIVKGTDHPIIPVYIGGAWGSAASYFHGMPKLRPLRDFQYPLSVSYGPALPATSTSFEVQQAVSELSVDAFEYVKEGRKSLGREFIASARRNWSKLAIADSSGHNMTYGETLTASLILRERIRDNTTADEKSIGILLPTGSGSALTNLATTLDRRISVNLNYTAPAEVFASAQAQCQLRTVVTSRAFLEHLPALPLPGNVLYIEDLLKDIPPQEKLRTGLKARLLPIRLLESSKGFDPDRIATILFSSGSTAEPKGVMLSHHNLLSNIEAFRSVLCPQRDDVLVGVLPYFHSFGYTATMWFPLLSGLTTVNHTNPLEAESIGKLAETYAATILLTTPSFLIAYARKIKPEQFAKLRYVFTGAEKLQERVSDIFEKRFGIRPLEGYGATELSPVCALSMPNVEVDALPEIGSRSERIGRVLPGMAIKIIHPETREVLQPGEEGLIHIKGPNVMRGYLNRDDLTESVLQDGWYNTGDIGLMDTDGFFAITGRLSRFSKIAGEMISHGAIEKALQDALGLNPDELAMVSVADEKKGEKICVLYTNAEAQSESAQATVRDLNIPNLWKPNPKNWFRVDHLPILGSGKLDYRAMQQLAAEQA